MTGEAGCHAQGRWTRRWIHRRGSFGWTPLAGHATVPAPRRGAGVEPWCRTVGVGSWVSELPPSWGSTMIQSEIIDLAIGLVFVWFVLSLLISVINEAFALVFRIRAKHLWLGTPGCSTRSTARTPAAFGIPRSVCR